VRPLYPRSRGQTNLYQGVPLQNTRAHDRSRGRVIRMGLRRVYPLVSDLNALHRQQMQSRFRAGPIQKGECMIPTFIPPIYGQAKIKN